MNENHFPIEIPNILPLKKYFSIHDNLNEWTYANTSAFKINKTTGSYNERTWGKTCRNDLIYFDCASYIKLKLKKYLKQDIDLIKIHFNGQTSFQETAFHTDFDEDLVWTLILFSEPKWSTEWGGEFIVFNPIENKYYYQPYIPNTGVIIPSNWEHKGTSPNSLTNSLRTTVAFSYCSSKIFKNMKLKYDLRKFI